MCSYHTWHETECPTRTAVRCIVLPADTTATPLHASYWPLLLHLLQRKHFQWAGPAHILSSSRGLLSEPQRTPHRRCCCRTLPATC
jgi:hypothetical protein